MLQLIDPMQVIQIMSSNLVNARDYDMATVLHSLHTEQLNGFCKGPLRSKIACYNRITKYTLGVVYATMGTCN
jgi:hypothetical protein